MENGPETATQAGDRIMALAIKNYRRDARFAALTDSAVHRATEKFGRIDPRDAEKAAAAIAREAVVFALTSAFEDDAELKYTREMLEKVMATMVCGIELTPSAMTIPAAALSPSPVDPR